MAKIDSKAVRRVMMGDCDKATIGNNRTLSREAGSIIGRLHGHAIFTYRPAGDLQPTVLFNTCGYATTTTRAAMQDFAESVLGRQCRVSFAGGGFNVTLGRVTVESDDSLALFSL
jgi:hypothetical protein